MAPGGSQYEGNADEQNNTCGDGDEESENEEEGEAEDSDSESELLLRETLKKQQYRKRNRRQSGDCGELPLAMEVEKLRL